MGQVLAVVSGKGGTGKTSLCAAVSCALAQAGQKVLCLDLDMGLRNLDLALGLSEEPSLCFTDVMEGRYPLARATVHPLIPNLHFLTAPVTRSAEDVEEETFGEFLRQICREYDWCVLDAPAGVGAGFRLAVCGADLVMMVSGGEPTALRDGARTAEMIRRYSSAQTKLVVNRIRLHYFKKNKLTVDDCMDTVGLPLLGIVPEDEAVSMAAARQKPLLLASRSKYGAAAACRHIAARLMGEKQPLLQIQKDR